MDTLNSRQRWFQERLEEHAGIMVRVVRTYCRDPEDQQDLAQEIKVNLWTGLPKYDEARPFSTWMYRIALNTAISWVRKAAVRNRGSESPAPEAVADDEKARILHELIGALDQMNRALLLLYMDDLSFAEIGDILGLTPGAVATRMTRLKQQLRQQIGAMEQNEHGT